jgi:hypothetical protein
MCGCVGVDWWVGGCVYKIEKFRTLSAPSEIASLRCVRIKAGQLRSFAHFFQSHVNNGMMMVSLRNGIATPKEGIARKRKGCVTSILIIAGTAKRIFKAAHIQF